MTHLRCCKGKEDLSEKWVGRWWKDEIGGHKPYTHLGLLICILTSMENFKHIQSRQNKNNEYVVNTMSSYILITIHS